MLADLNREGIRHNLKFIFKNIITTDGWKSSLDLNFKTKKLIKQINLNLSLHYEGFLLYIFNSFDSNC